MKKSILITGASSGIGRFSVHQFSQNNYRVFATYRNRSDVEELTKLPNVQLIKMDVSDATDIQSAFQQISDELGDDGLFAVINNAGITYTAPFEYADEKRAQQVIDVNVMAPYRVTQAFLPLLKKFNNSNKARSRVINIGSWAGSMAQPFIAFYNASKFGLNGLTESMYYDLALLGIHVVMASPGVTKTPLLDKATGDGQENFRKLPEAGKRFYKRYFDHYKTMSKRSDSAFFLTPEQVAKKLFRIVEASKPRYKYNLSVDAKIVDNFLAKFIPFRWRAAMNKSAFRLNK